MARVLKERLGAGDLELSESFDCAEAFGYGSYQKGVLLFAIVGVWVMHSHTLAFPLISSEVDHWCSKPVGTNMSDTEWKETAIPIEDDGQRSHCTVFAKPGYLNDTSVVRCKRWDYNAEAAHTTIISLWNLVCDRRWLIHMANAVFMAGVLGSLAASGFATDITGRKLVIRGAACVLMVAAFGGCFADTYLMYLCTRFVISGSSSALSMVACILLTEVSTNAHRAVHVSMSGIVGLLLGDACYAALKQARLNWIGLQLLMVAPTLLVPLGCFVVKESPRWLIARRDLKGAEIAMQAAAKVNGFPADAAVLLVERIKNHDVDCARRHAAASHDKSTASAVLRRGLIIYASSFAIMVAYYTLLLASSARDKTWMRWTSVVADAVCYALYLFAVDRMGRVALVTSVYVLAGTYCCFLATTLSTGSAELFSIALLIQAKAVTGVGVVVTSLCATEAFPSAARGLGVCLAYSCARLGGVFAAAASSLRAAGREDLLLVIVAGALYAAAQIFQKLPRKVTPFNPDSTRTTTVVSPSDAVEDMKKSLEQQPKGKVRKKRQRPVATHDSKMISPESRGCNVDAKASGVASPVSMSSADQAEMSPFRKKSDHGDMQSPDR
ncbi:solute carrier family 22 member 7-like [Dermacentor andersoni]|uniref:solute carrier family 22 member 7-like n=1 Tax=Dermacentor andersoni TaxID=34620 RepID=UPI0021558C18|nr:solute carrier family 22 member 6-like [Dermacentor andersoni]